MCAYVSSSYRVCAYYVSSSYRVCAYVSCCLRTCIIFLGGPNLFFEVQQREFTGAVMSTGLEWRNSPWGMLVYQGGEIQIETWSFAKA